MEKRSHHTTVVIVVGHPATAVNGRAVVAARSAMVGTLAEKEFFVLTPSTSISPPVNIY